jgi:hypothetical protein
MKTTIGSKVFLRIIGAVLLAICATCATTPETKKEQTPESAKPAAPAPPKETQAPEVVAPPAAPTPQKEATIQETYFVHTVKWSGESLSIIAAWYTGDLQNWKALADANPEINPNRVYERLKIRIPERIMTTKAPMTKEHVDSFYTKTKKPAVQEKDDEPKLFGPKEYPKK